MPSLGERVIAESPFRTDEIHCGARFFTALDKKNGNFRPCLSLWRLIAVPSLWHLIIFTFAFALSLRGVVFPFI